MWSVNMFLMPHPKEKFTDMKVHIRWSVCLSWTPLQAREHSDPLLPSPAWPQAPSPGPRAFLPSGRPGRHTLPSPNCFLSCYAIKALPFTSFRKDFSSRWEKANAPELCLIQRHSFVDYFVSTAAKARTSLLANSIYFTYVLNVCSLP